MLGLMVTLGIISVAYSRKTGFTDEPAGMTLSVKSKLKTEIIFKKFGGKKGQKRNGRQKNHFLVNFDEL